MEPSSSKPESSESTAEQNPSSASSTSNSNTNADSSEIVTTSAGLTGTQLSSVTTPSSTSTTSPSTVSSTATTAPSTTPSVGIISSTASTTSNSITTAVSSTSSNTSSITTTTAISASATSTTTSSSSSSSSVTISIGVGALQQQQKSSSSTKTIPSPQTSIQDVSLTKNADTSELSTKGNQKEQLQVPKSSPSSSKSNSPIPLVVTSLGEGPSGMKRPAPAGGESGGSSGPPSVGDPDSDTSATGTGDPKKKKMKKETAGTKDCRSESPGVSTTTGNSSGSGRGGRGGSGKQAKGNSSNSTSGKSNATDISKINPAATSSSAGGAGTPLSVPTTTTTSSCPVSTSASAVTSESTTALISSTAKVGHTAKTSGSGNLEKNDEGGKVKSTPASEIGGNGGPKVPPLKIVLQPHSSSTSSTSSTLTSSSLTGKSNKEKDDEVPSLNPSAPSTGFPYIVSSTTPDTANYPTKEANVSKPVSPVTTGSEDVKDHVKLAEAGGSSSSSTASSSKSSTSVIGPANSTVFSTPEISSSQSPIDDRKPSSSPGSSAISSSVSTTASTGSSTVTSSSSSTNIQQNTPSSSNSTSVTDKPAKDIPSPPSTTTSDSKSTKTEETTSGTVSTAVTSNIGAASTSKDGMGKKESKSGVSSSSTVEEKVEKDKESTKHKDSESSLGLKGPTRVTRSSHRIAAVTCGALGTPNSPNSVSPKTSACPSPSTSQHGDDQKLDAVEKMDTSEPVVDLHPRKRKLKTKDKDTHAKDTHVKETHAKDTHAKDTHVKDNHGKEKDTHAKDKDAHKESHPKEMAPAPATAGSSSSSAYGDTNATEAVQNNPSTSSDPPPMMNCFEMYFNIRKQIARRRRNLFPVTPKPPKGFKDYLMNRGTYALQGNANARLSVPLLNPPQSLTQQMKDIFVDQEKSRHKLRLQHLVEKEKLVLSVEQEILRVHGRAARALSNQTLPFSVCTILKDEEVYSLLTPEQEEKDVTARSRYNGRLFLSWLQDVDDKWDKIKEQMLLRHHNEAESLHAVQKMDWEWKLKEVGLCEPKATPVIEEHHVPMVHVSDDFDLLPA